MLRVPRSLLLALLATGVLAVPAHAGSYDVWGCHLTSGRVLPADGWQAEWDNGAAVPQEGCSPVPVTDRPGSLYADLHGAVYAGATAGWTFTAPANTRISGYTLWRAVRTAASPAAGWYHDYYLYHDVDQGLDPAYIGDLCMPAASCRHLGGGADAFGSANRIDRSGLDITRLRALLRCDTAATTCPDSSDWASLQIYASRIRLVDRDAPQIAGPVSGTLTGGGALERAQTLAFDARDVGSGLYRVGIVVDGARRLDASAAPEVASCRTPFTRTVPCPLTRRSTLTLDTAQIPNGTHTVQASVTDASGNETRSDPVAITTRNGSRPNGRGASRFVTLGAWVRSARAGQRASAVVPYGAVRTAEGRLADAAGVPIAGAQVEVASKVARPGAVETPAGTATTGDDGRFSYRLGKGPSRSVRFSYRAYSLDPAPVATSAIALGVRAGLRLTRRPAHLRNGQRVVFRGRLLGGPARRGTRVTIDVLVPDARRRVPIGNVRADARGRFRFAYRFRRTLVKARYRFQARLVAQPGYPYRGATSRRVAVTVRP